MRGIAFRYLRQRRDQVAYASFHERCYPLGSGIAESACKLVVEGRLKGSGMHWARANVSPMLALRGIACSDRWEASWSRICSSLRTQVLAQRHARRQDRQPAPALVPPTSLPPCPPAANHPKCVVDGHPTNDHPWNDSRPLPTAWAWAPAATL